MRSPCFRSFALFFLSVFDQAPEGSVYVVTRYRQKNSNLRTQLNGIIKTAGLEPWPKFFHNLRATRQTELAETMPGHVVCAWLGNTEPIARAHYLQVTEEHFAKAVAPPAPIQPPS